MWDRKEVGMARRAGLRKFRNAVRIKYVFEAILLVLILSFMFPEAFAASPEDRNADFQFSAPKSFIGFRIGRYFPEAKGELFDFITNELTLEKNDFRAWELGFYGGFALQERIELEFGTDIISRSKESEFRDWVDDYGFPITQQTKYFQLPLTAGVKILFIPRGRQVGRFAWLPERFVPYIGGGGGILWYRFEQNGEFVDSETLDIFYANLETSGFTPTAYLGGGMDIHLAKKIYLNLDVRYSWVRPEPGGDFVGFSTTLVHRGSPMDLSGMHAGAGLQFHF
jgi:hypothetical protein